MTREREGLLLLLLAATGYAFLPILAKLAYAAQLRPLELVTWRFILATPLTWLLLALNGQLRRRAALPRGWLLGAGMLFGMAALTAFATLERIPSSVYIVLLYSYPAMVALLSRLLGERLSLRSWGALGLTLAGVLLIVPNVTSDLVGIDLVGVGLGLLNATLYAVYIVVSSHLLRGHSGLAEASAWSITGSLLLLGGLAVAQGGLAVPSSGSAWAAIVALALVSTGLPIAAFYAGMQRIGAARAAILSTVEPLLTLLLAALLLHERMTPPQWLGGVFILSSVLLLQLPVRRRQRVAEGRQSATHKY